MLFLSHLSESNHQVARGVILVILATALVLIIAGVSCTDNPGSPTEIGSRETHGHDELATADGTYLFEWYYVNFAWGYKLYGMYIDKWGDIYSYRYPAGSSPWYPASFDSLTEAELRAKYDSTPTFVGRVDLATLKSMRALIPGAATGTMSDPYCQCKDGGGTEYLAYVYSPKTKYYKRVILYETGNCARKNLSDEADSLYHTIRKALGFTGPEHCGYPE